MDEEVQAWRVYDGTWTRSQASPDVAVRHEMRSSKARATASGSQMQPHSAVADGL